MIRGFYKGEGVWWLPGWYGKDFDGPGPNTNVFKVGGKEYRCIRFETEEAKGVTKIKYALPFIWDEIVPDGSGGYSGKIYLFGIRIGTFRLIKPEET